jgi:O-acetyl-ADP-ribose deacetylase (regulator of RNase III)
MQVSGRLEAIEADITTLSVDAIVNAANSALMPGGGVDGAIRKRAGRELDEELRRIGSCCEGEAVITDGYRLPAAYVIHTVAPIWAGGKNRGAQEAMLARCYTNALKLADENRIRTIAFPAIGTGAYRWPSDVAAKIAFDAVMQHLKRSDMQSMVTFCCFARVDRERYSELIEALED